MTKEKIFNLIRKFKIKCKIESDCIEIKYEEGKVIFNQFNDDLEICLLHETFYKNNNTKCSWMTYNEVIDGLLVTVNERDFK